jgi:hypothetical protein
LNKDNDDEIDTFLKNDEDINIKKDTDEQFEDVEIIDGKKLT